MLVEQTVGDGVKGALQKLPVDRVSREGPQFQAEVPEEPLQARPFGREADDPRACLEILTAAEALASVKGQECLAAKALPMDATHDLELLPPRAPSPPARPPPSF